MSELERRIERASKIVNALLTKPEDTVSRKAGELLSMQLDAVKGLKSNPEKLELCLERLEWAA